jgi:phage protein D
VPAATAIAGRLRAARPALWVGGREEPALALGLTDLAVEEHATGLLRCEARFGNWGKEERDGAIGYRYFDRRLLDFGKDLQVKVGGDLVFDGRISALEGHFADAAPPELSVYAEDRLQDLRMTRRTASYVQQGDADVIRAVAGRHGLGAQVDVDGATHAHLAQVNQTDLAFLRDRCRAIDAELWMEGTTLHAKARVRRGGTPIRMGMGNELRALSVLADLARQRTSVAVAGWDVRGKAAIRQAANDAAIRGELGADESGAQVLAATLGAREETLVHGVPFDDGEARGRAEATFRLLARRFVVARGVADADARLRVGTFVELAGIGPLMSGRYYLAAVRHVFDPATGMRTEFTAERPGLGRP